MTYNALLATSEDSSPIELSYEQRADHTYILGITGKGKSTVMAQLAVADMNHPSRHGLCVLDPHGTLVDDIMWRVPAHRLDDVILIDPGDPDFPFAFNLFAPMPDHIELDRYASELVGVFEATFGTEWRQVADVMRNLTLTLLARDPSQQLPHTDALAIPAMDEIPHLLHLERIPEGQERRPFWQQEREAYRSLFYDGLQQAGLINVLEFWKGMYDNLTPRLKWGTVQRVLERVNRFLGNPLMARTLAQTENKLNFDEVLDDGRILLVNLSKSQLGEENSRFLGSVLLARLTAAVFKRDPRRPQELRRFHLMVDEFHNIITASFPRLFTDGRKFGVDIVVAHQKRGENLWAERTAAAGNLICFELHGGDQREMAGEFNLTPPAEEDRFEQIFVPEPYNPTPVIPHIRDDDGHLLGLQRALNRLPSLQDEREPVTVKGEQVRQLAKALAQTREIPALWKPYAEEFVQRFTEEGPPFKGSATFQRPLEGFDKFVTSITVADGNFTWALDPVRQPSRQNSTKLQPYFHNAALLLPRFLARPFRDAIEELCAQFQKQKEQHEEEFSAKYRVAQKELLDNHVPNFIQDQYVEQLPSRPDEYPRENRHMRYARQPGRPRAYADIQLEIANRLAHLGKYTAMFKLSNEEATETNRVGKTLPLPPSAVSHDELDAIKSRMRERHCRPRAEVDEELLMRYQARLRAVGYTEWTIGAPLPDIPLYVSDDEEHD